MTTSDYAKMVAYAWRTAQTWDGLYRAEKDPQEAIRLRNAARYFRRAAGRWEVRLRNAQASKSEAIA